VITCAAMAAVALCGYGLSSTGAPAKTTHASAVSLSATTPPLPAGNPAEGHSPQLQRELSGPLTGTGITRPGSTVRMSTMMQAATASAAGTMLNGVDVSCYQHSNCATYPSGAPINWASVAAAGYKFAAIKVTEGNYYPNPYYASDATAATAAGMYVAPYAFGNPYNSTTTGNGTPQQQADYAVQNAAKAQNATSYTIGGHYLPIELDIEYDPYATQDKVNECYGLSTSAMVSWITSFTAEIKTKTGVAPIIYTPQPWWSTCTGNSTLFGGDVLWVPAYSAGTPGTLPAGWNTWNMWQYTSSGNVSGINDPNSVDLDYFSGAPEAEQTTVNTPASIQVRTLNALAGQTVSYTATGLPADVTINSSGLITGTPTATGTYNVTVTPSATGTTVEPASVSFTWQVLGTLTVTSPGNQKTTAGSAVNLQVSSSASVPAFTATGLPPGLSISSSGLINGWPTTPGTYSTTVKATDSTGASGSASFTWTVSQAADSGPSGRVVLANGGKCLDDTGGSTANGNKTQIWTCNGGTAQKWTVVQDGTVRVLGKCLAVSGGGTANGTSVLLWSCKPGDGSQRWQVGTDGELVNPKSGKCLDDPYSRTANGTKLDIWSCNGGSNQHWTLPAAPLASGIAGKCLDDTNWSTANGNKIQIYTCTGGTSQTWTVEPDGTVRIFNKCLDVTGEGTASGTKLQLWSCVAGDSAQRWQFAGAGELVNPHSGKCLADPADSTVNGTWTEIEACPAAADPGTSWHVM
jgi:GH25 family lysozyme M1 (1,4-beta-N-acetylmuramidase)